MILDRGMFNFINFNQLIANTWLKLLNELLIQETYL